MENIIKKAIEGGWEKDGFVYNGKLYGVDMCAILDPLFWQALGKACGWEDESLWRAEINGSAEWYLRAMCFHEINLTQSWDKAVEWLEELVNL